MPSLHNRYEIDDTRPLPELDGSFARAYAAKGKGAEADLVALVCTTPVAVRGDAAPALRSVSHPALLRLKEAGSIDWPMAQGRAFTFIYEKPPAFRLMPKGSESFTPMKEEPWITALAQPLFSGLNMLAQAGIFHGAVRAGNVFMASGDGKAVLGDGFAQPAGHGQPVVYETAERAMAEGQFRGIGGPADDFYALGVTLLAALIGEDPLRGMAPQDIINLKLERGSYAALAGERRFSPGVIELLRGLLADDPVQRWTMGDFDMWMEGRRLTPKQSMAAKKATRAFPFMGQNYLQPRQLAQALAKDSIQGATAVKGEELSRWLAHGLRDETMLKHFEEARTRARHQRLGHEDERLVTNAVMALDPIAPLRYRGLVLFPAGMPAGMAEAVLRESPLQPYMEIILNDLPALWLTGQAEKKPSMIVMVQQLERAKDLAEKSGLGYGPERALYEISPLQPCLSPAIRNAYALTAGQLLEALDKRGMDGAHLVDRHIAAFLLARDRRILPQVMREVEAAGNPLRKGLALLTLFGDLQFRFGPEKLRGLSRALLPYADEAVRRFHNRPRQGKIREGLRAAAEAGHISGMLKLVDDPEMLALDGQEFEAARLLYRETEVEAHRLAHDGSNKKILAIAAGQPIAAVVAVGFAFILAVYLLLRAFLGS